MANAGPYNYTYIFKYIIIGDMGVGKSCLLHQFTEKKCKFCLKISSNNDLNQLLHNSSHGWLSTHNRCWIWNKVRKIYDSLVHQLTNFSFLESSKFQHKRLNYKFGILLVKNVFALLHGHITVVLPVHLWFMI